MAGGDYRGVTFELVLHDPRDAKIQTIKLVTETFKLGLAAAKKLVEQAPVVLAKDLTAELASSLAAQFQAVGATVSAQPAGAFAAERERGTNLARGAQATPATATCTVVLLRPGHNVIEAVRLVRELTGSSLRAAKEAVDGAPTRIAGVATARALEFRRDITHNGGEVALEP